MSTSAPEAAFSEAKEVRSLGTPGGAAVGGSHGDFFGRNFGGPKLGHFLVHSGMSPIFLWFSYDFHQSFHQKPPPKNLSPSGSRDEVAQAARENNDLQLLAEAVSHLIAARANTSVAAQCHG